MAKSPSLGDSLEKHLECAVCLEQYTEPKVLPCLHSFCKRCLQGLLIQEGAVYKINCPSCRSRAEIPQGKIDLLPANFFVNNLLSIVTLHKDSNTGKLSCDICDSGDNPVNRCTTCSYLLCKFCTQAHRRARNSSSHSLMSLEEAKNMGSAALTKPAICNEHEGEVIKLFCETCEEAICRDCTVVKHRDHKYTFVRDAFSRGQESLQKILSETKTKAAVLKEAVNGVLKMKRTVQSCAEQTVQEVVNCFDELTVCLDARKEEMIDKVEDIKKAKLKSLEIQQEELETALGIVQSSVEFTEKAFENGSQVEILNMRKQMSSRLQDLNSATWQLEPCVNIGLKFKDDKQLIIKEGIASIGDITDAVTHAGISTVTMGNGQEGVMYNTLCGQPVGFTVIAKERNGRRRTEGGDAFCVSVNHPDTQEITTVLTGRDNGNGTYHFSHTPGKEGWYTLSVLLNGHHVQGSPFTWIVEMWGLQPQFSTDNIGGQVYFSEESSTVQFACTASYIHGLFPHYPYGMAAVPVGERYWTVVDPKDSQHPAIDRRPYAMGSVAFNTGRHTWKVKVHGSFLPGFSFGICSAKSYGTPWNLGKWWVWNSKQVYQFHSSHQERTVSYITQCKSNDIIELYLDLENGTLLMYNAHTKQSDTLLGVERDVLPVFRMSANGDKISLKI